MVVIMVIVTILAMDVCFCILPQTCSYQVVRLRLSALSGSNTPLKINMEPENHLLEKENHLPNHHFSGSMLKGSRVVT